VIKFYKASSDRYYEKSNFSHAADVGTKIALILCLSATSPRKRRRVFPSAKDTGSVSTRISARRRAINLSLKTTLSLSSLNSSVQLCFVKRWKRHGTVKNAESTVFQWMA